jgi:hypothetical protein
MKVLWKLVLIVYSELSEWVKTPKNIDKAGSINIYTLPE